MKLIPTVVNIKYEIALKFIPSYMERLETGMLVKRNLNHILFL